MEVVELFRSTLRKRSMITMAWVIAIVHVSVKPVMTVEPGTRSYKHSANKPIRAVVPVRSAVIRFIVEVPVWAHRRYANVNGYLGRRNRSPTDYSSRQNRQSKCFHCRETRYRKDLTVGHSLSLIH
jgi:hypothetical protein